MYINISISPVRCSDSVKSHSKFQQAFFLYQPYDAQIHMKRQSCSINNSKKIFKTMLEDSSHIFKTYCKVTVIKTMSYWGKPIQMHLSKRIENLKIKPYK